MDISKSLRRSDHAAIIMGESRCSLLENTSSCAFGHRQLIFQDLAKSRIWGPRGLFRTKNFFQTILISSTTSACLRPPLTDFSGSRQIAYLGPQGPIQNQKIFTTILCKLTTSWLGQNRAIFQNFTIKCDRKAFRSTRGKAPSFVCFLLCFI